MAPVAHLTSAHPPFDTRIFVKELSSLAASGRKACLIACHTHDETKNGVNIISIPRPSGRMTRMLVTPLKVLWKALRSGAMIVHFHDPELIPIGFVLKAAGCRIIYDVHEDLPRQIGSKEWLPPYVRKPASVLSEAAEWLAGRAFDGIVAATPDIANRFPKHKTLVVQNFPIADELLATGAKPYAERPRVITYIGGISRERGAVEMIDAMEYLKEANPSQQSQTHLELAGPFFVGGFEQDLAARPGWSKARYLGVLDRDGVRDAMSRGRVGLVLLHPTASYLRSYPVKLFEYMAAGIPVIASDFPLWRSIVEEAGAGLLVDPRSPRKVAEAIEWILENEAEAEAMGRRGREAVLTRYNWAVEERKLLEFYDRF